MHVETGTEREGSLYIFSGQVKVLVLFLGILGIFIEIFEMTKPRTYVRGCGMRQRCENRRAGLWQRDRLADAEGAGGQAGIGVGDLVPLLAVAVVLRRDLPEGVALLDGIGVGGAGGGG